MVWASEAWQEYTFLLPLTPSIDIGNVKLYTTCHDASNMWILCNWLTTMGLQAITSCGCLWETQKPRCALYNLLTDFIESFLCPRIFNLWSPAWSCKIRNHRVYMNQVSNSGLTWRIRNNLETQCWYLGLGPEDLISMWGIIWYILLV